MNMFFKIKFIWYFFFGVSFIISCNDAVEDVTNSATERTFDGQLRTIYSSLQRRNVFDAQGYPYLWADAGVDLASSANFNQTGAQTFRNDFSPTSSEHLRMWGDHYFGLAEVNRAIEFFEGIRIEDSIKVVENRLGSLSFEGEDLASIEMSANDIKAQARFVRAILNFNLVKAFENPVLALDNGGELITDLSEFDLSNRPNSNPSEFFAAIVDDLIFAENNLKLVSGNFKRATVLAAKALLGKVYLQMAGCMKNDVYQGFLFNGLDVNGNVNDLNSDDLYQLASDKLGEVIDSGAFSLMTNYGEIFDPSSDPSNSEMIFQVDFVSNGVNTGSSLGDFIGPNGGSPNGGGTAFLPQFEFITSFLDTSLRSVNTDSTFVDQRIKLDLGEFSLSNFTDVRRIYPMPISDQRFLVNLSTFGVQNLNRTNNIQDVQKNQSLFGTRIYKYRKSLPEANNRRDDQDFDFPYLRYADVLLLRAEALVGLNPSSSEALELLNMVRRRAYLINPTEVGGTTPGNDQTGLNAVGTVHNLDFRLPYVGAINTRDALGTIVDTEFVIVTANGGADVTGDGGANPGDMETYRNISLAEFRSIGGVGPTYFNLPDSGRLGVFNNRSLFRNEEGLPRARRNRPPNQPIFLENDLRTILPFNNNSASNLVQTILPQAGLNVDFEPGVDLLSAILRERRKELCFEGHRRDDLIRNGVTSGTAAFQDVVRNRAIDEGSGEISRFSTDPEQYFGEGGSPSGSFFLINSTQTGGVLPVDDFQPSIDFRLPIPQIELTRNPLLNQNPGYPGS